MLCRTLDRHGCAWPCCGIWLAAGAILQVACMMLGSTGIGTVLSLTASSFDQWHVGDVASASHAPMAGMLWPAPCPSEQRACWGLGLPVGPRHRGSWWRWASVLRAAAGAHAATAESTPARGVRRGVPCALTATTNLHPQTIARIAKSVQRIDVLDAARAYTTHCMPLAYGTCTAVLLCIAQPVQGMTAHHMT